MDIVYHNGDKQCNHLLLKLNDDNDLQQVHLLNEQDHNIINQGSV